MEEIYQTKLKPSYSYNTPGTINQDMAIVITEHNGGKWPPDSDLSGLDKNRDTS